MLSKARPRVLYVDNDEDSRDMLSTLLEFSRFETRVAADAAQALSLSQEERFDLYLLEAWLPGLDGFELCRCLRASDPITPILFYSGAGYSTDKRKGIEAGANAYWTKPDLDGLVGSITHFVSHAESVAV
jgi:DNA-binding response OmpR family regulator